MRQLQHTNVSKFSLLRGNRRPGSRRSRGLVALVALVALASCSATFDWRSVAVPGTQLVVELPCRPSVYQRDVDVAGARLKLSMLSCETGGVTYGVATADVGDPARVDAVLHALRDSAVAALRSAQSRVGALSLHGATPFSGNSSVYLQGQRPDGQTVEESVRMFARGTRVFQVSAVGASLPDTALSPFLEGVRFALEKPPADPI